MEWLAAAWQWLNDNIGSVGAWASIIGVLLAIIVAVWLRQRSSKAPAIEIHGDVSHSTLNTLQAGSDIHQSRSIHIGQAQNINIYQYGSTESPSLPSSEAVSKLEPKQQSVFNSFHDQLRELAREEMGIDAGGAVGLAVYLLKYTEAHRRPTVEDYDALQTHLSYILATMDWCYNQVVTDPEHNKPAADILTRMYNAVDRFFDVRGFWNERVKYGRMALQAVSRLRQR